MTKTTLKERIHFRAQQELILKEALARANAEEKAARARQAERRSISQLSKQIALTLDLGCSLRRADTYQPKTYNEGRRIIGLINHVYSRYPAPWFLYRCALTDAAEEDIYGRCTYADKKAEQRRKRDQEWLVAVLQGKSLFKAAKSHMTRMEAHHFLLAPTNFTVEEALLYARAAAAGVPHAFLPSLVGDFGNEWLLRRIGARLHDLLRFLAEALPQMGPRERIEVRDYLVHALEDKKFSLKGRTLRSVLNLCEEWHKENYFSGTCRYMEWPQRYKPKQLQLAGEWVEIVELTNTRLLSEEGRTQLHCVFSYGEYCMDGTSAIVSFRWLGHSKGNKSTRRVTAEISPERKELVQLRGRANSLPSQQQLRVIKEWAADKGLRLNDPTLEGLRNQ